MQELNSLSYLLPSANETMCTRIPMFLTRFCRFELKASSQTKLIKRATALLKNYLDDASCPSLKNDNAQGTTTPKALQRPRHYNTRESVQKAGIKIDIPKKPVSNIDPTGLIPQPGCVGTAELFLKSQKVHILCQK